MFVSEAILLIRLYNARIMPMLGENDCSILEGELWTDGERISYVGPARADMPEFDRELDLGGDLIIPGFKDAHTHIPMVFLRSFADGLPLQEWLFQQIFPREAKLYKAIDRIEAVIQHNEAPLDTWIELEKTLNLEYGTEDCARFPFMRELREIAADDTRRKLQNT